ncbi:MAG: hypothetical protein AAFU80_19245 [Pseudomonadota bacterium]
MQIRYERPMPELTFLIRAPLRLSLDDGQEAEVEAWSLEGIQPPEELMGERGEATLKIPFHGFEIAFNVTLVRDHEAGLLRFVGLNEREERVLKHFYREIVTGRAVSMDRMITAMDTPVEKVPMSETPAEAAAGRSKGTPRAVRAVAALALYAGLLTFLHEPVLAPVWQQASAAIKGEPARAEVEAPVDVSGAHGTSAKVVASPPDASWPL